MSNPADHLPADVLAALQRGNTIEAIKLLRAATGVGLREAKERVDAHLRGIPSPMEEAEFPAPSALPSSVTEALQRGNKFEAIKRLREQTGLGLKEAKEAVEALQPTGQAIGIGQGSPGEVARKGSGIWWLVVLALAALAGYYFMR